MESEKRFLKSALRYFIEWKHQQHMLLNVMGLTKGETDKLFVSDQTYENLLLCVGGFFAYSEALLMLTESHSIKFIPGLHCNQSSIENFFSRMRNIDKDRTDLYGGGVLQQNVMNDIYGSNKKRKIGNSSYPEWMINEENLPTRKEMRIGETVIDNCTRMNLLVDALLDSLSEQKHKHNNTSF